MTPKQFVEKAIEGGYIHKVKQTLIDKGISDIVKELFDEEQKAILASNDMRYDEYSRLCQSSYARQTNGLLQKLSTMASRVMEDDKKIKIEDILIDPLAWAAVGKVDGWKCCPNQDNWRDHTKCTIPWKSNMHRMIDALVEGKSLIEFLETL